MAIADISVDVTRLAQKGYIPWPQSESYHIMSYICHSMVSGVRGVPSEKDVCFEETDKRKEIKKLHKPQKLEKSH